MLVILKPYKERAKPLSERHDHIEGPNKSTAKKHTKTKTQNRPSTQQTQGPRRDPPSLHTPALATPWNVKVLHGKTWSTGHGDVLAEQFSSRKERVREPACSRSLTLPNPVIIPSSVLSLSLPSTPHHLCCSLWVATFVIQPVVTVIFASFLAGVFLFRPSLFPSSQAPFLSCFPIFFP